jgi:Domain of unknown function (DUF4169)
VGEIVNLNRARKARDKAQAKRSAEVNRTTFGRSRAEREAADRAREKAEAALDGHRLDDD